MKHPVMQNVFFSLKVLIALFIFGGIATMSGKFVQWVIADHLNKVIYGAIVFVFASIIFGINEARRRKHKKKEESNPEEDEEFY